MDCKNDEVDGDVSKAMGSTRWLASGCLSRTETQPPDLGQEKEHMIPNANARHPFHIPTS